MRKFIIALLQLVCSVAHEQTISGKITDAKARPISDAFVYLLNTNLTAFSNEQGDFTITNISPGEYAIVVSAIGYATVAEKIKVVHASALPQTGKDKPKDIEVTHNGEKLSFKVKEVDMIVEARLEEIMELVDKELKQIDRSGKLPGGVVLVGGGADMKHVAEFTKEALRLPVRVAKMTDMGGISDKINKPEFAVALGLMLLDFEKEQAIPASGAQNKKKSTGAKNAQKQLGTFVERANSLFKKFKA